MTCIVVWGPTRRCINTRGGIPMRLPKWHRKRCAAEKTGSQRVLEGAGMRLIHTEKNGLVVSDRVYDKLTYEYRRKSD